MCLFVCVALSGVIFTIMFVPETNGKQLDVLDVVERMIVTDEMQYKTNWRTIPIRRIEK